jgi:phenylalanine-4-hydroxylase
MNGQQDRRSAQGTQVPEPTGVGSAREARLIRPTVSNAPVAGLRGDYEGAGEDYVVDQRCGEYTEDDHALWRRLYERQMRLVPGYACEAYLRSLASLDVSVRASQRIPDFEDISKDLRHATGWSLAAVPGLIPDLVFFRHLSERRFPVTRWLRKPEEFDYIVEPDVFHDFFGHVPMLFDPVFADYIQAYGKGGLKAAKLDALDMLARLYWYTVEFGLIAAPEGLRIYGAGILSSGGEVVHSIDSPQPQRVMFNLERVMRTRYHIDRFQDTYFVIEGFGQLFRETEPDFAPIYERLRGLPEIAPDGIAHGDVRAADAVHS